MMTYKEACDSIGYQAFGTPPDAPEPKYVYFAYKAGKAEQFETLAAAKAYSANFEKVQTNESEYKAYWSQQRDLSNKALAVWDNALHEEFNELTPNRFNACYVYAYARSHADGYDAVAQTMDEIVNLCVMFANDVYR